MRLANVDLNGSTHVAIILGDELVDLTESLGSNLDDVIKLINMGAEGIRLAEESRERSRTRIPLSAVKLKSPILMPDKFLGIGMNYHSGVAAAKRVGISFPPKLWFYRPRSCIVGPYDEVWHPRDSSDLDYEAELIIVIGKRCRHVTVAEAPAAIAGFTIGNDLTLRERVMVSPVFGKSYETHTPIGPWIVTPDEIQDPHRLSLKTWVNGNLCQNSNTSEMIQNCYEMIAELSTACILNPGDIILTGTPDGCGLFQQPPGSLSVGDVVKIEIENIGVIENCVIEEPPVNNS